MKVLEDLVAPAVMSDLVSRLISFLIERYGKRRASSCSWVEPATRLELLALKIHAVVDEAEQRHMGEKRSLLLWLEKLMDGMYRAYFAVDSARHRQEEDDGSNDGRLVRSRPMKRCRTVSAGAGDDDDGRVVVQLSLVLESLESATADLKDFVQLLACCPTIPRAANLRSDGKFMFGRLVEREHIIGFLTRPDADLGILPVVGGPEVGKGTIVKHVCEDPRVRRDFDVILYSYGSLLNASSSCIHDALGALLGGGHLLHEAPADHHHLSGRRRRRLLVIKNTYQVDIDREAWAALCASLRRGGSGSRIIVVSENDRVAELGTVDPLRVKPLRREEYWYFFRSLALGPVPEEHPPGLAVLGRRIAAALHGSFFGAKVLGGLLRSNLDERFWRSMLGVVRRFQAAMLLRGGVERQHFSKLGIARMVIKVLPMPLKLKCASQSSGPSEFPAIDVQQLLHAGRVPAGVTAEMRVVLWESGVPA